MHQAIPHVASSSRTSTMPTTPNEKKLPSTKQPVVVEELLFVKDLQWVHPAHRMTEEEPIPNLQWAAALQPPGCFHHILCKGGVMVVEVNLATARPAGSSLHLESMPMPCSYQKFDETPPQHGNST